MLEVERDANLCGTVCLWGSSSNPDGFLNQCIQRVWQLGELCLLNLCPCLGLELCCRKIPRLPACIDTSLCLQIFLEVSHGRNLIYIQNPKPWETRLLDLQPLKQERTVESSRNVCESQYHICHSSRQVDRKQAIRWPLTSPPAQGVSPAECETFQSLSEAHTLNFSVPLISQILGKTNNDDIFKTCSGDTNTQNDDWLVHGMESN